MQHGSKDNSGRIEAAVAANLKRYFAAAAFFINTFQIAKKSMTNLLATKRTHDTDHWKQAPINGGSVQAYRITKSLGGKIYGRMFSAGQKI